MSEKPESQSDARAVAGKPDRPRWWRVLGIRRRDGKWLRFGLTLWGWFLVFAAAAVIGGAGFAEYSMQPDFCRSCHIMEPYYQAWHRSTHKNVPCQDCHFEPGWRNTLKGKFQASAQVAKYVTRTYGTKPHAEIQDASCLRSGCHERRLLEGMVEWEVATERGYPITVHFNHAPHLGEMRRGIELRCVSCHSQIVQGEHLTVTVTSCFLCHFKGLKHGRDNEVLGGCRSCHGAPEGQIRMELGIFNHQEYLDRRVACLSCHSDSIEGDGKVPKQVCGTCHNKAEHLGRFGDIAFLHLRHVTEHKVECSSCHLDIEHRLSVTREDRLNSCTACHEGSHAGPKELYWGVGGRGVPDMPSPMARTQVDCIGCHRHKRFADTDAEVVGQTFAAAAESCSSCHGTKYDGTLEHWKQVMDEQQKNSDRIYEGAVGAVAGADLSPSNRRRARILLGDAEHNRKLVMLGHAVHNVNYATALLNAANDFCRQAEDLARSAGSRPAP